MPPLKIYCHGVFDHCQEGHDRHLLYAKYALLPEDKQDRDVQLVVGLINDATIVGAGKIKKLLFNQLERQETLFHCKHVDDIVADVPWSLDQTFLDKNNITSQSQINTQNNFSLMIDS